MIANKECFERGCACYDDRVDGKGIEVVAKHWVGLTDEQFLEACQMAEGGNYMVAFQRIQQWLMDSNT